MSRPLAFSASLLAVLAVGSLSSPLGASAVDDLRTYTREVAVKDSSGADYTVRIPAFVSKGGFLDRGEQAITGKGLEQTLSNTARRTRLFQEAFSKLATDNSSPTSGSLKERVESLDDFRSVFQNTNSIMHEALGTKEYDAFRSSILAAAAGLSQASKDVGGTAKYTLKDLSNKLRQLNTQFRQSDTAGKLPKSGDVLFTGVAATLQLGDIISDGLRRHQMAGVEALTRLDTMRQAYTTLAGGQTEAERKFPAEMKALENEKKAVMGSTTWAGAFVTAFGDNYEESTKLAAGTVWSTCADKALAAATKKLITAFPADKALIGGSSALLAGSLMVESMVIGTQVQQGTDVQKATVYATVAVNLQDAAAKTRTGELELRHLAAMSAKEHNSEMVAVAGVPLLGGFHDVVKDVFGALSPDDPDALDRYRDWSSHYKEALKEAQTEVAQTAVALQLDDARKGLENTLSKVNASDLLRAEAAEGKVPLSPTATYMLVKTLDRMEELGMEIPNFAILVRDPERLGPFLQQVAKATNQSELIREVDAWVAKPVELAAFVAGPRTSDIDEEIKLRLAGREATRVEERTPLEMDEAYNNLNMILRHPVFNRPGNSSFNPNDVRTGRPAASPLSSPSSAVPGAPKAGTASSGPPSPLRSPATSSAPGPRASSASPTRSGLSSADLRWLQNLQSAVNSKNADRVGVVLERGIRGGTTTRIGQYVGVDPKIVQSGNELGSKVTAAYFNARSQGMPMPKMK